MVTAELVKQLRDQTGAGMMDCKKALEANNGDVKAATDWLREKGIAKAEKKQSRIAAEGLANIFIEGNKAVVLEINSETDFVAKNDEFKSMVENIGKAILASEAKTMDEANALEVEGSTVADYIVAKTAKIGEKLSFRRFEVVTKADDEAFGSYLHNGGKIAVLTVVKGSDEAIAKDVAMQAAAMKPRYVFESDVPAEDVENERKVLKEQAMNEGKPAEIAEKMVEGRMKKFYKENCLVNQLFIKDDSVDVQTYLKNNSSELVSMTRYEVGEGLEKRVENFAEEVAKQIAGN
ncbi:MAG: elongation factor Ts [Firmicutes bacterium]|jgi:elongation factor Ts|nr:elongation factor Ts [Bacillota bacterium]